MFIPNRMRMTVHVNDRLRVKLPALQCFFDANHEMTETDVITIGVPPELLDGLIEQLQTVKQFLDEHPYERDAFTIETFNRLMERNFNPEDNQ